MTFIKKAFVCVAYVCACALLCVGQGTWSSPSSQLGWWLPSILCLHSQHSMHGNADSYQWVIFPLNRSVLIHWTISPDPWIKNVMLEDLCCQAIHLPHVKERSYSHKLSSDLNMHVHACILISLKCNLQINAVLYFQLGSTLMVFLCNCFRSIYSMETHFLNAHREIKYAMLSRLSLPYLCMSGKLNGNPEDAFQM